MTALDRRQFNRSLLAVPAAALLGTGLGALAPAAASAAPADWNAHLLAGQANGELMHQTRAGDGTWKPRWTEVDTASGTLYYMSSAGIAKDLHVVASINGEPPKHCFRSGTDGSWTAFGLIPSLSGPTGAAQVAVTSLDDKLHVFAASGTGLYHTVRNVDGSWWASWKLLRTFASISHIATTRVGTTIDTAVVTNGEILHAIRSSGGTWTGWGNVESGAGEIGAISRVALAGIGSQLQVVALTGSGDLYHAIRKADATWQQFKRMTAFANYTPIAIGAANVGGETQVAVIDLTATSQVIRHTIRSADGTWQPIRTVPATGLTANPGDLALTGTR